MDDDNFLGRTNAAMGENLERNEPQIFTAYWLIGAILFFGGAGYLMDRWLDSSPWLLLIGLAAGVATGSFGLIRLARRS
jgi:F0F1-type ATP synthase assembly protein I